MKKPIKKTLQLPKKNDISGENLLLIIGASIVFITLLIFQMYTSNIASLFFLVIFQIIFFIISEIINTRVGTYTAAVSVVFTILFALTWFDGIHGNYAVFVLLFILFACNYLIVRNIRKRRLMTVSKEAKHFHSLANYSMQPLILKDDQGSVMFASESIRNLLKIKSIPKGAMLEEYIHPEDRPFHRNFLEGVKASPYEKKSIDLRMKTGDGSWIWVKNDSINLLKHKHIRAIVSTIQDISFQKELDHEKAMILSKEKKAREQAELAVRQRDEFLAIASHELKTPLTSILLQLQATLRKISSQSLADFSGAELLKSLRIAEAQSKNLSTLIKDLLNVSLASANRLTLNKTTVDLPALVKTIIQKYSEEIRISGCKVNLIIEDEQIVGNWDPVRLEQAIANILLNSLKYAPDKRIDIKIKKDENYAVVRIRDFGKGISKKQLESIFEPFKRATSDATIGGLGVGLFISKQIALAHGGDIMANTAIKKGAEFILRLPVE